MEAKSNYLRLLLRSNGGESFLLFLGLVPPILMGVASVILYIFLLTSSPCELLMAATNASLP